MGTFTRRLTAVASATLVIVSGLAIVPLTSASAASNGDWSAYPKRPKAAGPQFSPRQYFFFDLPAGSKIADVVTIKNSKRTPLRLALYPADAFNVRAGGGFALTPKDKAQKDVGTWVTLSKKEVVIPPAAKNPKTGKYADGTVNVPFTLTVPRSATPGDHAGGIVTIEPAPSSTITQPTGAIVAVRRSLAVRIYTRVSGPLNPQLLLSNIRYTHLKPALLPFLGDQGSASIEYTYVNNGNVRITPLAKLTYKGFLGRTLHSQGPIARPEILPGQTITLTDAVLGMPVLDQVTARVEMRGNPAADRSLTGLVTAADVVAWSISWIFVVALVILIVAFIAWRRARSRKSTPSQRGKRAREATPA